jgi:tRNA (cytidine/uridine-2'-O-)-methyltransferase
MRIALYEPDIPQNTGAILRLAGCLGIGVDVVEPCGFAFDDRRLRRAGMDYLDLVAVRRHTSWPDYLAARRPGRLVLLTTQGSVPYHLFRFRTDDTLLLGRESAGAPAAVHAAAEARIRIPMVEGARSLNVAVAAAIVAAEALRQVGALPERAEAAASA